MARSSILHLTRHRGLPRRDLNLRYSTESSAQLPDTLSFLALLPADAQLTLTVRKSDLMRALDQHTVAEPENLDTKKAAAHFGYSMDRWRRWAEHGKISGAWQDARGGSWHLPFASCETHIRELQRRGRTALVRGNGSESSSRSLPRGPRAIRTQRLEKQANEADPVPEARAACA